MANTSATLLSGRFLLRGMGVVKALDLVVVAVVAGVSVVGGYA